MSSGEKEKTVRPYNLLVEDRVTRARMPTLEVINDRFSRFLRAALFQHLRKTINLSPGVIEMVKHSELMESLTSPSYLALISLRPLRGTMLMVADAPLVVAIVESRFGGNGRFPASVMHREFTPVEQKVMTRVMEIAIDQFVAAWQRIGNFQSEIIRYEFNPQFASVATASEAVVVIAFNVKVDHAEGCLRIGLPYTMLEPLREQLISGVVSDAVDADEHWYEMLKSGIEQVLMPLSVELAEIEISVRDLMDLKPGDVFELDRPQSVVIEADGTPLFRGRWGRFGSKSAVRIEETLLTVEEILTSSTNLQIRGDEQHGRRN